MKPHNSPADVEVDVLSFEDAPDLLKHPRLPVLVYRDAVPADAGAVESLFTGNGWAGTWRDGIFGYAHYHSNAHEVLGVVYGAARVRLGGDGGRDMDISAGDVLILPAGTGHQLIWSSGDFLVVGAYPEGQEQWDIQKDPPDRAVLARIAQVPLPESDPVFGRSGPALDHWYE